MSKLTGTLIFITGAAVGIVTGAVWTKKKCDEFYRDELDDVNQTLRDMIKKNKATKEKIIEDVENIDATSTPASEETSATIVQPLVRRTKITREKRNYSNIVENNGYVKTKEEREEEEEEQYKFSQLSNKGNADDPYAITVEQFADENDHYDKITLYYYEDDGVIAEENEEVLVDADNIIGTEFVEHFGDDTGDPEITYVRNDKIQVDYEIIRLSKSYAKTVLGYDDED